MLRGVAKAVAHAEKTGDLYLLASVGCAIGAAVELSGYHRERLKRLNLSLELDERTARYERNRNTTADEEPCDPLWRGTVTRSKPLMLLGDVMLRGARVGQEVEVLATQQGQGEGYLQCRNITTGTVGLYPTSWVRRNEARADDHTQDRIGYRTGYRAERDAALMPQEERSGRRGREDHSYDDHLHLLQVLTGHAHPF